MRRSRQGKSWIGVSVITGRLTTEQMFAAAEIADKYCEGDLRTTNQQNYLFPNIDAANLEAAKAELLAAGFSLGRVGVPSRRRVLHRQRVLQSGDYGNQRRDCGKL